MNYILFDPPGIRENLLPLTFTRPVCELRIGILNIREKWEKWMESECSWDHPTLPCKKVSTPNGRADVLINGSIWPDKELVRVIQSISEGQAIYSGEVLLAAYPEHDDQEMLDPEGKYERQEYQNDYLKIQYPWDLFTLNGKALESDFSLLTRKKKSEPISESNNILEPGKIFMEEGARVEFATLNASNGPIYIGKNAEIMEGSMVRGPFSLGAESTLKLGAKIYGPTTIGPYCKVGGEVNNTIIAGYSNKAHDGFLGNSVIGEWCNIGADSNNSNLKNNYSTVRLWNYIDEKFVSSGLTFCGLIMGDHSKCGINTMFNTGTVIGVSANIFGSGFPRNFIPSYSWGGAQGFTTYQLNKALEVAENVMERRAIQMDALDSDILSEIFRLTEKYRS